MNFVAEWLRCLTFVQSRTPNLKVGGSIPHAITSIILGVPPLCITYSIIKGQLLSYHVYIV